MIFTHQHQLIPFEILIGVLKDRIQLPSAALSMVFDNQEQKGKTILFKRSLKSSSNIEND